VHDAVAVALIDGAVGGLELFDDAAARFGTPSRVRCEALEFLGLKSFPVAEYGHPYLSP
jgi:hypothetical protein